jgi:hypothetical protein
MTRLVPVHERRIADAGRTRDLLLPTGVVLASVVTYVTRIVMRQGIEHGKRRDSRQ